MIYTIIICVVTCLLMILGVLFFPKIKLGKIVLDSYWVVTLIGALILIISGLCDIKQIGSALIADTAINPLKILVLFISMTILSIFLDELGFFRYLANAMLKKAGKGQFKLFLYLYIIVSVLTVFTSNDIIILSFTPFICYFAKNAKINPTPYLAAEFVGANTWSMMIIIGNPTNIYLATAYGIDFMSYLKVMALPTLCAGVVSFILLYLMFRKTLKQDISGAPEECEIKDKPLLIVGVIHLAVCTILLAIGSYIKVEMWLVSVCAVASLFITTMIFAICRKRKPFVLYRSIRRAPFQLIPFVLSMFVMIFALEKVGVTEIIAKFLGEQGTVFTYGFASFLSANLVNNIPMSVLFASIIQNVGAGVTMLAVYATIIGSNLGALLTPIGALADIMWSNILGHHKVKFGFLDFLKIGFLIAIPSLATACGILLLII